MTWQTGHRPLSAAATNAQGELRNQLQGWHLGWRQGRIFAARVLTRSVLWYVQATFKTNNSSGAQVAAPSRPLQILGRPRRRVLLPSRRAVAWRRQNPPSSPLLTPGKPSLQLRMLQPSQCNARCCPPWTASGARLPAALKPPCSRAAVDAHPPWSGASPQSFRAASVQPF